MCIFNTGSKINTLTTIITRGLPDISKIEVRLEDEEIAKLKTIVNDLFESKAIKSNSIEEFLKFNVFIIFDEYNKNVESFRKFYRVNLSKYNKN